MYFSWVKYTSRYSHKRVKAALDSIGIKVEVGKVARMIAYCHVTPENRKIVHDTLNKISKPFPYRIDSDKVE